MPGSMELDTAGGDRPHPAPHQVCPSLGAVARTRGPRALSCAPGSMSRVKHITKKSLFLLEVRGRALFGACLVFKTEADDI